MSETLNYFLNTQIPRSGYHPFNSEVELYSEKDLFFRCGCGDGHLVKNSRAIIDFPIENKAVYACQNNDNIFNLVKATGFFSITGLKTIASYTARTEAEQKIIILNIEARKSRG